MSRALTTALALLVVGFASSRASGTPASDTVEGAAEMDCGTPEQRRDHRDTFLAYERECAEHDVASCDAAGIRWNDWHAELEAKGARPSVATLVRAASVSLREGSDGGPEFEALRTQKQNGALGFLKACAALDKGHLTTARKLVDGLSESDKRDAAVRVLRRLIDRRASHADEKWVDALVASWRAESRPDLHDSVFLHGNDDLLEYDCGDAGRWLDGVMPTGLAAVVKSHRVDDEVRLLSSTNDIDRRIAVATLARQKQLTDTQRQAMLATARELAATTPHRGYDELRLFTLEHEAHRELSTMDLDALDRTLAGPLDAPFEATYERIRATIRPFVRGDESADRIAFRAAVDDGVDTNDAYSLANRLRAMASDSPAQRPRALRMLVSLGRREAEGHTLLERLVGLGMEGQSAASLGDEALRTRVAAETEALRQMIETQNDLAVQLEVWPLARLREEVATDHVHDEVGWTSHLRDVVVAP